MYNVYTCYQNVHTYKKITCENTSAALRSVMAPLSASLSKRSPPFVLFLFGGTCMNICCFIYTALKRTTMIVLGFITRKEREREKEREGVREREWGKKEKKKRANCACTMYTVSTSSTHYNTLQHTATHYNTLQHTATLCNTKIPGISSCTM